MGTRRSLRVLSSAPFALSIAIAPASALAEPGVQVACSALSADDAAEVEARTRATLLTEPDRSVEVRVDCADGSASVRVTTQERSETAVLPLPSERAKDAVLGAIERLLESRSEAVPPATSPAPAPAKPSLPPPKAAEPRATAPSAATRSAPPATPAAAAPTPVRRLSASLMVAQFSKHFAFGGRASVETGTAPWAVGLALGAVTAFELADAFVPTEWHGAVVGSVDDTSWSGLRFSLGLGASVLSASPSPGVVARSGTTITSGFAQLGVARPVHVGRLAVVPALELRLFPAKRRVSIDGSHRFELPIASVAGLLGATLDF